MILRHCLAVMEYSHCQERLYTVRLAPANLHTTLSPLPHLRRRRLPDKMVDFHDPLVNEAEFRAYTWSKP